MENSEKPHHKLEERAHELEHRAQQKAHEQVEQFKSVLHSRPAWWKQVIFIGVLYGLYTLARNVNGSAISVDEANQHALDIVRAEKWLYIFNEHTIQDWFLQHARWLVRCLNVWYGTAHFIVTIASLLWLYFFFPRRYTKWRNVIFGTTFFALIGYMIYPLTPPRLLPASYGFEDTLITIGGFLDFSNQAVKDVSNQYAAMPSLHAGWSTWCAFAMFPVMKHWWSKAAMAIYPCITIMTIVITANHYWLDVVGGWFVLLIGWLIAETVERRRIQRLMAKGEITEADLASTQG
jgi:hypothetical protein